MKILSLNLSKLVFVLFFLMSYSFYSQNDTIQNPKKEFLKKVQFGGGLGLNLGNGNTNVTISPSAIYNFNKYVSSGVGLQVSYLKYRGYSQSFLYGGSLIGLFNPIDYLQASVELEQLRANVDYIGSAGNNNFWNTALFLGAAYRTNFGAVGAKFNVLDDSQNIYGSTWLPFVRVYF